MKKITFYPNGNSGVFIDGEQVSILQESWIILFFNHLIKNGYDPTDFDISMPNGAHVKAIKLEDGSFNWKIN